MTDKKFRIVLKGIHTKIKLMIDDLAEIKDALTDINSIFGNYGKQLTQPETIK